MTLIERLKEIDQRLIDFSEGQDTVYTIALSLSSALPEIIQTLERQQKLLDEARKIIKEVDGYGYKGTKEWLAQFKSEEK